MFRMLATGAVRLSASPPVRFLRKHPFGRMMPPRHRANGVLHEDPAVTALPVPGAGQPVTSLEGTGQVPVPRHLQPVPDAMHALEAEPAVLPGGFHEVAEPGDLHRIHHTIAGE